MSQRFVVMGVSGCGKTTIGRALAEAVGGRFIDGDDLHPVANVAKMREGKPLDDADRLPWLEKVGQMLRCEAPPVFIACSALRRTYRKAISSQASLPVTYLYLHGTYDLIHQRLAGRAGHFMPASLLASQFATLEPLAMDEGGITVDIDRPVPDLVADLTACIRKVKP